MGSSLLILTESMYTVLTPVVAKQGDLSEPCCDSGGPVEVRDGARLPVGPEGGGVPWGMGKPMVIVTHHPGLLSRLPEHARYIVVDPDVDDALEAIAEAVRSTAA